MQIKPLKQCKILVTPTSFARYDKKLLVALEKEVKSVSYNKICRPLKEKELLKLVGDIDGFIAGLDEITANVIEGAKNLRVISRYGTGVDNVDLAAAKAAGIYITNTPGSNAVSVAELTIGFSIALARDIVIGNTGVKNGQWPRLSGITLAGKTFGIIGLGNIGKELAIRLAPFGIKIIAYDINFDHDFAERNNVVFSELEELFEKSDFVSLHIPIFNDNQNLINKRSLSLMKAGAILINTARGELIDEDALYESLSNGHLKAAALDTLREEPPDSSNRLLKLPNLITTPHMGAATDNASNEMTRVSIEECLAVLRGEKPRYIVVGLGSEG